MSRVWSAIAGTERDNVTLTYSNGRVISNSNNIVNFIIYFFILYLMIMIMILL